MRSVEVKQPGKIILFGEHFVVHGSYAVAFTINRFVTINAFNGSYSGLTINFKDGSKISYDIDSNIKLIRYLKFLMSKLNIKDVYIEITLDFPISAGLGSSASMAVGMAEALYKLKYGKSPKISQIYSLANKFEEIVHGKPSGVDLNTILVKKIILYDGKTKQIVDKTDLKYNLYFIVADTLERRDTGKLVSNVSRVKDRYGEVFNNFIDLCKMISINGFNLIKNREKLKQLGKLMILNHGILASIGVSTERIEELVNKAMDSGALGAKLTGAGGGGCIIALVDKNNIESVVYNLRRAGADVMVVTPFLEG